jgi:hypothetical protein
VDITGPEAGLHDDALAQEIALLGEVISAAVAVGRVMTQPEVDVVLGLSVEGPVEMAGRNPEGVRHAAAMTPLNTRGIGGLAPA